MDKSSFLFSIVAAIIGMGVVFLFLSFLSVLMSVIGRLFRENEAKQPLQVAEAQNTAHNGMPSWVTAVAAAYLLDESESTSASAANWNPLDSGRHPR